MQAAERLFGHYGFGKTTVADIAREAGVAVGSVYLEFASKDAIVTALSAGRYDTVLHQLRQAIDAEGSYASRLQDFFERRASALLAGVQRGTHACELLDCSSPAVVDAYTAYANQEEALLAGLVRDGMAAGEFVADDPSHLARTLLRVYASFGAPAVYEQEKTNDFHILLKSTHTLVLQGLLPR